MQFFENKRVLVTGGTGMVGTPVVEQLLQRGAHVRVPIHRRPLNVRDPRIETMQADLTRSEECLKVAAGMDYVVHAAGTVASPSIAPLDLMKVVTTNLVITAYMLQASWQAGVDHFVLIGSSTVYPAYDHAVNEDAVWSGPTHPSYFAYGWMRRYLEQLGLYVASKSSLKVTLVRPTAAYGRYDNFDPVHSHVIPALIRKALERRSPFEVWGTGDEVRDFLHATDLARSCLLVLEKGVSSEPVNIGYGKVVTIRDVVHAVLKATDYTDAEIIFDSSKPTTIPFRMVDIAKARSILDFEPQVSLEEGVKDTVEWYKRERAGAATHLTAAP